MEIGNKRKRRLVAGALAVSGAIVGDVLLIATTRIRIPSVIQGLMAAIILAAVFAALQPWWRRLDFMQRDGRLRSWYWGGLFGGLLGLWVMAIFSAHQRPMLTGAVSVLVAQAVGYIAMRTWWWATHRAEAA